MSDSGAGPTGSFPRGKLSMGDLGELNVAIGEKEGEIVIDFGTNLSWIGLSPDQAIAFGEVIVAKANLIKRKQS